MRGRTVLFATAVLVALAQTSGAAAQLKPATLATFERYVQLTEARMTGEHSGAAPFLWIDRQPEAQRRALLERLRKGQVVSAQLDTRDGNAKIPVSDGAIHHWIGTVLLPGVPLDKAEAFVKDYPRYPERFAPMILRSRVVGQSGNRFDVEMRTSTTKVITVVIDATYHVDYRRLSPTRLITKSHATDLFQVTSPGKVVELRRPVEEIDAFLWRINMYCSFDQREEGTYEQCESVSLTRPVPWIGRVVLGSMIEGVARDTLAATLGKVRSGLIGQ